MKNRMLYLDDEIDLLDIAKDYLQDESLIVDTCTNVDEALLLVETNPYDLIISDEKMPSGSGTEFLKSIYENGLFKGKAILITGEVMDEEPLDSRPYDIAILKPIQFEELSDTINSLLA